MNTPALVTRSSHNNLPEWSPSAPGYLSLETGGGGGGESSLQGANFMTAVRKYWWVVLLIWALVAIPTSILAYKYIPAQYVAKNAVEISPVLRDPVKGTDANQGVNQYYNEYLRTQAEMIKNPFVLQRATEDIRLKKYAWFNQLPDQ